MLKAFSTCIATTLLTAPVLAQELTTQRSAPDIIGELLTHSGTFAAQRSTVAGGGDCEGEVDRRVQTSRVFCDPPYREPPKVFLNLNTFKFAPCVWTWCDTNLYEASGTYFVLGELGEFWERGEFGGQGEFRDRANLATGKPAS